MVRKDIFKPVNHFSPAELKTFMTEHPQGAHSLVDGRQPGEDERIAGSKLIPLMDWSGRSDELPGEKPAVAYCLSGSRSLAAARILKSKGHPVGKLAETAV